MFANNNRGRVEEKAKESESESDKTKDTLLHLDRPQFLKDIVAKLTRTEDWFLIVLSKFNKIC